MQQKIFFVKYSNYKKKNVHEIFQSMKYPENMLLIPLHKSQKYIHKTLIHPFNSTKWRSSDGRFFVNRRIFGFRITHSQSRINLKVEFTRASWGNFTSIELFVYPLRWRPLRPRSRAPGALQNVKEFFATKDSLNFARIWSVLSFWLNLIILLYVSK